MLKQVHWMTPKQHWTLYGCPICFTVSESLNVQSISFYGQSFLSYRSFGNKSTEWPKWSWTLWGQRYPVYVPLHVVLSRPNFIRFALRPVFSEVEAILRKVHRMTQMTLGTAISNVPHSCSSSTPSLNPFYSTTSCFRVTGNLRQVHRKRLWTLWCQNDSGVKCALLFFDNLVSQKRNGPKFGHRG